MEQIDILIDFGYRTTREGGVMQDHPTREIDDRQLAFALQALLKPGDAFPNPSSEIEHLLSCQLPAQERDRTRKVRRLQQLVRICARNTSKAPTEMRKILSGALVKAVYKREWTEVFRLIWEPLQCKHLRGAYQMSLRIAQEILTLVQQSILVGHTHHTRLHNGLLDAARMALRYGERGFFDAGPKVKGVRLSRRFGTRLQYTFMDLALLSHSHEDKTYALDFKQRFQQAIKTLPSTRVHPIVLTPWFIPPTSEELMN